MPRQASEQPPRPRGGHNALRGFTRGHQRATRHGTQVGAAVLREPRRVDATDLAEARKPSGRVRMDSAVIGALSGVVVGFILTMAWDSIRERRKFLASDRN